MMHEEKENKSGDCKQKEFNNVLSFFVINRY